MVVLQVGKGLCALGLGLHTHTRCIELISPGPVEDGSPFVPSRLSLTSALSYEADQHAQRKTASCISG